MKILIIEDEKQLAESISDYLSEAGYLCEWAANYLAAIDKANTYEYDCILLDIMLPGGDGLKILEELKQRNKQDGVIIISAKGALEDKIKGLHLGADDYLAKPFHLSELNARIYSLIRRKQFSSVNRLLVNELQIDLLSKSVIANGAALALTKTEYDLLLFLIANRDRIISKSAIAEHLSGEMADMMDNYSFVYAHLKNLKKKLADAACYDRIKTVYGTGYKWES